jgi:hypothetical protein
MKTLGFALVFLIAFSYLAVAESTQVVIDLNKITPEEAQAVMQAKQSAEGKLAVPKTVDEAEKWANTGMNIAKALGAACKELSIGVNEFARTPVGQLTTLLIVWKVIGHELVNIIGGSIAWIFITLVVFSSYRYFHMSLKMKKADKTVEFVPRYTFKNEDYKMGSIAIHAVIFVVFTGVCMLIVFH